MNILHFLNFLNFLNISLINFEVKALKKIANLIRFILISITINLTMELDFNDIIAGKDAKPKNEPKKEK